MLLTKTTKTGKGTGRRKSVLGSENQGDASSARGTGRGREKVKKPAVGVEQNLSRIQLETFVIHIINLGSR